MGNATETTAAHVYHPPTSTTAITDTVCFTDPKGLMSWLIYELI